MFALRLLSLAALVALTVAVLGCSSLPFTTESRPAVETQPITYVAIGASDTVGVGADRPEVEGWVPQLAAKLPPGSKLVNLGISGSLLSDALRQQLPVAVGARPDLVTVWLAVNDFNAQVPLPRYQANLDTLLGELEATGARVYVGNVPDLTQVPIYGQFGIPAAALSERVAAWNRVIAETAARHGATVIDINANWQELAEHPEYVSSDGFHPSAEGYRRLAELFWAVIAPGLGGAT